MSDKLMQIPEEEMKATPELFTSRLQVLIELGKWGLGKRDLVPNLNWFSKVVSDDTGNLSYVTGSSTAGDYVDLSFEMNTLVVLNTCQHPLDPSSTYAPKPVLLSVFDSDNGGEYRSSCPENERAILNTENYHALRS